MGRQLPLHTKHIQPLFPANQKHSSKPQEVRGGLVYSHWKLYPLFFIPFPRWNKRSGTGGSSQRRKLTDFTITLLVAGELVGDLDQLGQSDTLALNKRIPTNSPWGKTQSPSLKMLHDPLKLYFAMIKRSINTNGNKCTAVINYSASLP